MRRLVVLCFLGTAAVVGCGGADQDAARPVALATGQTPAASVAAPATTAQTTPTPPARTVPRTTTTAVKPAQRSSRRRYHPLGPADDTAARANASTLKVPGCDLPRPTGTARRDGAQITVDWKVPALPAACGRAILDVAARSLTRFGPALGNMDRPELTGAAEGRQKLTPIVGDPVPPYQAMLTIHTERGQWRTTRIIVAD